MTIKKIAIQGIKGAFHEEAAIKVFGSNITIDPCNTFTELTEKVKRNEVDYALMAIENTISGTILTNYELIRKHELTIIDETYLRITQNLGVKKGACLDSLTEVSSHYMALNQCRDFFADHTQINLTESIDTAYSIKTVADSDSIERGAIGSKLAIEYYGLDLLAEGIETNKQNYTRFAVLSKSKTTDSKANKVSLSLTLKHQTGSLFKVLSLLNSFNINLTKIESSPILGEPFHYRFYIDLILNTDMNLSEVIDKIRPLTKELITLGQYKAQQTKLT